MENQNKSIYMLHAMLININPLHPLLCLSLQHNKTQDGKTEASLKVHLHWAKANVFLWSLALLNMNIKLDFLQTHLEEKSLSLQNKRTPKSTGIR